MINHLNPDELQDKLIEILADLHHGSEEPVALMYLGESFIYDPNEFDFEDPDPDPGEEAEPPGDNIEFLEAVGR